jgi:hypothetical protein
VNWDKDTLMVELTFVPARPQDPADTVVVVRTPELGPGGHCVYVDASGIVRAEISDRGEVRMLATNAEQRLSRPVRCRPLTPENAPQARPRGPLGEATRGKTAAA